MVVAQKNPKVKPWKLYKWSKKYTLEDGALFGAGLGLAASIPTLFMRRPAIPRWTRCVGMVNIGACAGMLGMHGYLQYTGERQKAYKRLDRRLKRRSLEFWAIFWDKELMAQFDPVIQQYVRHNGIWYTHHLPDSVFEDPDAYGRKPSKYRKARAANGDAAEHVQEEQSYYTHMFDYAEDLKQINTEATLSRMEELEEEKTEFLLDAEFLLYFNARKQYDYCHLPPTTDEAERARRLREMHLLEDAYSRLRSAAHAIDVKLDRWRMSLQHKAVWEATSSTPSPSPSPSAYPIPDPQQLARWLPKPNNPAFDFNTHNPVHSLQELDRFQTQLAAEAARFEELSRNRAYPKERRERWKKDLEDGRILLKAADQIVWELERRREEVSAARRSEKSIEGVDERERAGGGSAQLAPSLQKLDDSHGTAAAAAAGADKSAKADAAIVSGSAKGNVQAQGQGKPDEDTEVEQRKKKDKNKLSKPPRGGLESGKS